MIVANLVGDEIGFDSDENEVLLAMRTGELVRVPRAPKREIADRILDEALNVRRGLAASTHGR
jgi:phosphopantothenoylcysteine decarboxylase / phosphopantothenate---cysteine ligase